MPYIEDKKARKIFDNLADDLVLELMVNGGLRGNLNYFIFKLFKVYQKQFHKGHNYSGTADFLSELHECEEEIRRRFLVPYENKKIEENGDVE